MLAAAERLRREYSVDYPFTEGNHWQIALPFLGQEEFIPLENHILRQQVTKRELQARAWRSFAG